MKQTLLWVSVFAAGAGCAWWLSLSQKGPHNSSAERWLDANHARIRVRGRWEDIALIPLADHLCRGGQPLFERYCNEPHSYNLNN